MIFKIIRLALILILCVGTNLNLSAQDAALLPNAKQTFLGQDGKPLSGGKVYFYVPNTSTLKTTWQDADGNVANTNPVILDSSGRAIIYGSGEYRQVVRDRNNNLIWDQLTSSTGSGGSSSTTGDGDLVGTIKPWAGLTAPNQYLFTYGQEVSRTTYSALFTAITLNTSVFCTNGNATLTGISDTTQIPLGAAVEVTCMTSGTIVVSKTSNSITTNNNASLTTSVTALILPWGGGNGTTTFNLPDLRGRVVAGRDNMGGTAASRLTSTYFAEPGIGAVGGLQSKTLVQGNLPAFKPSLTVTDPGHTHSYNVANINSRADGASSAATSISGSTTGSSTTGITVAFTNNLGSDTPFSIVQPTIASNYIIKVIPDTVSTTNIGVTSINSMTGAITCSTGLLCSGNLMSVDVATLLAAPSAQVGLSAIPGSASTAMRSDAAPALNVSISPTWTGTHTFSPNSPLVPTASFGDNTTKAASTAFVQAAVGGNLAIKTPVKAATTNNITLSGAQTIDGISVVAGDRVLVKNQSTGSQNGIYDVAAGAWTRVVDLDASGKIVQGTQVYVTQGTLQSMQTWVVTTANPITIGSTSLTFTLLNRTLSVTDFGAIGDNSTNNNTAFSNAVAKAISLGGATILIPPGKFVISSEILINSCTTGVFFEGAGISASVVRQTSGTANGFNWNCGGIFTKGGGLTNLTIESGTGWVSGGNQGLGSTGSGVIFQQFNDNGILNNVGINNFATGWKSDSSWHTRADNITILYARDVGINYNPTSALPVTGGLFLTNSIISNNGFTGTNTGSIGLLMNSSAGGDYFTNVQITVFNQGWVLRPLTGKNILYFYGKTVAPDSNLSDGIVMDTTNGQIISFACYDCWTSYNGANGLNITGTSGNYSEIYWYGLRSRENANRGIYIQAGNSIKFIGGVANANSRGNTNIYPGMQIANSLGNILISGMQMGNNGSSFTDQAEGLVVGTSAFAISLIGNDFNNPGSGKSGYTFGSGSNWSTYGNTPFSDGDITTSSLVTRGLVAPSADNTYALGTNVLRWTTLHTLTNTIYGSSSGAITIAGQAAAGTFNFNLPTTAGSAGQCLASGGGGASPMTWTACSGGGGGSPGGVDTQVQFNNAGAFGGSANFTWVSPALTIGAAGSTTGQLKLTGSTSGTITIAGQAAAGTYNFNLPTAAGSSGECLKSGGGGASAMTFGSCTSSITPAALTKVDDTNVTLTLGGTPTTALLQATSLTLGWTGRLALSRFVQGATNTVLANATAGTADFAAFAMPSCSTASSALIWTTSTGFGCNTSITANAVPAANLTGSTLAAGVTASSLTSVGTLTSLNSGTVTITSTSASALAVGRQGATDPVLKINANTASVVTGIEIIGAAAAGGVNIAAISSGVNENLTINAKGSGTITLGNTSTGAITLTRATTMSAALTYGGVTLSNAVTGTGNMVLSAGPTFTGTITGARMDLVSAANAVTLGLTSSMTNNTNLNALSIGATRSTTSGAGGIYSPIYLQIVDSASVQGLSNQVFRLYYQNNNTANGSSAYDALFYTSGDVLQNVTQPVYGIYVDALTVASGKTLTTWEGIRIAAPAGAGTVTNKTAISIAASAGPIVQADTTEATSTTTGSVQIAGGVSIRKHIWADGLTTATGTPSSICRNSNEITVNAATSCVVSSMRFKNNITDLPKAALPMVMSMKPSTFYYKEGDRRQRYGFIAEQLASVDKHFGDAWDEEGPRSIDQVAISAIAIKAIQELKSANDNLINRIKVLERKIGKK